MWWVMVRYRRLNMMILAAVLIGGLGCSQMKRAPRPEPVSEAPVEPEPEAPAMGLTMTASDGRSRIDLFGVIPEHEDVPFVGRSAGAFQQHTFTEVGADLDPHLDRTGQRLVFASTRHASRPNLYMKSVTGRAVTQLTSDPAGDVQPAFSPDGNWVAFASDRAGSWDIWILAIDAGRPVQVTRDAGHEVHPSWSPDGQRLVYCAVPERGGDWELWIVDLNRPATKKSIVPGLFPRWSPTGDAIAFQRPRQRDSRLFGVWTIALVDGEPRRPTEIVSSPNHALITPAWSPDGRRLAYSAIAGPEEALETDTDNDRPSDIWMVEIDGSSPIRLTDGSGYHYTPTWSPDGRVYFPSMRSGQENIWSVRPVTGAQLAGPVPTRQIVPPAAQGLPVEPAVRPAAAPQPAPEQPSPDARPIPEATESERTAPPTKSGSPSAAGPRGSLSDGTRQLSTGSTKVPRS